jgi:NTP pyrophosphatase (non-canonical NTP hydrolase)
MQNPTEKLPPTEDRSSALAVASGSPLSFDALRAANARRGIEWMGGPAKLEDLSFCAMELGGESGEVLNAAKKLVRFLNGQRGGIPLDESRNAIAEELADVVICCDRVAEALNIDLGAATADKFNKTSRKYGLSVLIKANNPAQTPEGRSPGGCL